MPVPGRALTLQDLFSQLANNAGESIPLDSTEVLNQLLNDSETLLLNVSGSVPTFTTGTNYPILIAGQYPIAYWRLADDALGTAFDSNPNTFSIYPRIASSSMANVTQAVTGFLSHSKATQFTAVNSQIVFSNNSSLQITTDMTIEFLVKFASLGTVGTSSSIISKEGATQGSGEFAVYLFNNAGTGTIVYGQASSSPSGGSIAINTLYHVAVVRTSATNTVTFYINGSSVGSGTYTTPTATANNVTIGNALYASPLMTIQEVAVYRKALTGTDVANHYAYVVAADSLATAYGGTATLYGGIPYPAYGSPTSEAYGNAPTQWGTFQWK